MKRIAIMNNGTLPIPSVLGGAVETLVQLRLIPMKRKSKCSLKFFLLITLMQEKGKRV